MSKKVHALVAQSKFRSQNVQTTPCPDHFWKLKCRKSISWEGLHFGASNLQVCWDDFAWQVQHFVWPGSTFSWQAQYFRQVEWKNRKTHWYEAVSSALNFPWLKEVAELFRFWQHQLRKMRKPFQVQKLRTSRWIAAFLMLSSSTYCKWPVVRIWIFLRIR